MVGSRSFGGSTLRGFRFSALEVYGVYGGCGGGLGFRVWELGVEGSGIFGILGGGV